MEWQPIETAPKDGEEIIVYGMWTWPTGFSPKQDDIPAFVHTARFEYGLWQTGSCYKTHPTHWMPLPKPPAD